MDEKTVALCLPRYSDLCPEHVNSLIDLMGYSLNTKTYYIKKYIDNTQTYIARNRNIITKKFLEENIDYAFWIDSDILVPKDSIEKMISLDKDIVSGLYVRDHGGDIEPVAYISPKPKKYIPLSTVHDSVFEVDAVGFGCVLIKREVFEEIERPWFEYDSKIDMGEDINFCMKAKEVGFSIFLEPTIKATHLMTRGLVLK